MFASPTNFVKLLTNSTNFVKLFAASTNFVKGWFHPRYFLFQIWQANVFRKPLHYITTTLLSGCYLQCFCVSYVYNDHVLVVPKVAVIHRFDCISYKHGLVTTLMFWCFNFLSYYEKLPNYLRNIFRYNITDILIILLIFVLESFLINFITKKVIKQLKKNNC